MKLSLSKLFDPDAIVSAFTAAKISGTENFVLGMSELLEKTQRALNRNINHADNIDCITKEIFLRHNTTITLANPENRKRVRHAIPTATGSFNHPVTAFAWQYNADGNLDIKAQLLGAPADKVSVTIILYF